ncbi:MAG: Poly(A) polymerase I [Candidatus Anoxychlamydiales bacterium]|nr:Poly(A) polymerase I [Candidatus Anoxychlamydiales bacterium]NGX41169.1 Poly(A) polymerase I [Candidatus Anoxychlamydiales bacterium]HEU64078.1 polynucleotide adenylyltransferase PcnB [Chlamydiota bacterium]
MRPPKVYSIDEHRIPTYKIDKQAYYVIEKLRQNGFISFLVGGGVRDLLLNVRPKDFDISTSARPEEIKKLFKRSCILIGRRFRLAHIRFGKKIIEVSTFRAGEIGEAKLILRDNIFGTPQQDVLRRDFTINGLFYDVGVQTVIDYVGGYLDLEKKILRTIGDAKIRFIQDPVRMIRLLKFKARFDFEIAEKTFLALQENKGEILKSSPARILEEFFKMLESGAATNFFYLLTKHEVLDLLTPTLSRFFKEEKLSYDLIKVVDNFIKKNHPKALDRSILISSMIFYILEKRLQTNYIDKKIFFHLGIIAIEAKRVIDDVFRPFFHISKKMKAQIVSILVNQFRIFPLIKSKRTRIRIPRDPFFDLALDFFNLRCQINPELTNIYTQWREKFIESHSKKRKFFKRKNAKI